MQRRTFVTATAAEKFASFIKAEQQNWAQVAKAANVRPDA